VLYVSNDTQAATTLTVGTEGFRQLVSDGASTWYLFGNG